MTKEDVIQILSENGFSAKKSLGQNFLLCEPVLQDIVDAAGFLEGGKVLEVGPGLGFLTHRLLTAGADVTAIELSDDMVGYLRKYFKGVDRFKLVHKDILKTEIRDIISSENKKEVENDTDRFIGDYSVVANIPYYLTGKLVSHFLESPLKPKQLILMIQKEVAERLVAKKGKQSKLSIATHFFADAEKLFNVSKECFHPVPKVESAVVRITPKTSVPKVDQELFFRTMKMAFSNKRKQIHNTLVGSFQFSKEEAYQLLEAANIEATIRPDKMSVDDFVRLSQVIHVQK